MVSNGMLVAERGHNSDLLAATLAEMTETEKVEEVAPTFIDEQIGNQTTAWVISYSTSG